MAQAPLQAAACAPPSQARSCGARLHGRLLRPDALRARQRAAPGQGVRRRARRGPHTRRGDPALQRPARAERGGAARGGGGHQVGGRGDHGRAVRPPRRVHSGAVHHAPHRLHRARRRPVHHAGRHRRLRCPQEGGQVQDDQENRGRVHYRHRGSHARVLLRGDDPTAAGGQQWEGGVNIGLRRPHGQQCGGKQGERRRGVALLHNEPAHHPVQQWRQVGACWSSGRVRPRRLRRVPRRSRRAAARGETTGRLPPRWHTRRRRRAAATWRPPPHPQRPGAVAGGDGVPPRG
mmetsp:Transcript_37958/g.94050  ORF Transcript_37958/g.94050 Transcript_37958/m.94050 type:complete len:291 (-) Transcript_37958:132-1004(-)